MPQIEIYPPVVADTAALLDFELANRAYFERRINARLARFYSHEAVRYSIEEASQHRLLGTGYQYLIKSSGKILGRVNLSGVEKSYYNKATLGYRIGEAHAGSGVATRAVNLVLTEAFEKLGLWRIEALVRDDNIGSVRVLEKNGFSVFGRAEQSMYFNQAWHDLLHFECRSPKGPSV
ncbi:MAG: GNAT family protein [Undibacterium sp.]|nr:GNAT family protein [Undibacterium sp.]